VHAFLLLPKGFFCLPEKPFPQAWKARMGVSLRAFRAAEEPVSHHDEALFAGSAGRNGVAGLPVQGQDGVFRTGPDSVSGKTEC